MGSFDEVRDRARMFVASSNDFGRRHPYLIFVFLLYMGAAWARIAFRNDLLVARLPAAVLSFVMVAMAYLQLREAVRVRRQARDES